MVVKCLQHRSIAALSIEFEFGCHELFIDNELPSTVQNQFIGFSVHCPVARQASRDFVALFILNPASEALVPARCALAKPYMLTRVLRLKALTPDNIQVLPRLW